MKMSIDEFRKRFPHLAKEMLDDNELEITVHFDDVESDVKPIDPWHNYTPTVVDYIRRCKTVEEAYEVIDYLEKRGEISSDEARMYREKLEKEGLRSFGPMKEDDYYYKEAYNYWRKLSKKKTISQK